MRRFGFLLLALTLILPAAVCADPVRKHPSTAQKRIALTFDDGPHKEYTQRILEILKTHGVKATFFIVGENAERYPDRIQTIAEEGHELGNHTYSHASVNKLSPKELEEELEKTSQIIERITGIRPKVFRPPFGAYNDSCVERITSLGYRCVLWSKDSRDWELPPVGTIVSTMEAVSAGDILLFHDYNQKNSPTPSALEQLIPKLLQEGYEFVTVSQLLEDLSQSD